MFMIKPNFLSIFLLIFFTGCSIAPKTDIKVLDENFITNLHNSEKLSIVDCDIYTIQQLDTDKSVLMQFGLIGGLAGAMIQRAEDKDNFEIEVVSYKLYQDTIREIKARLAMTQHFEYIDIGISEDIDPIEFSRAARDNRFWGNRAPKTKMIQEFIHTNQLDYALYAANWGGVYANDNSLFMNSRWVIFNPSGRKVVSVFIRNVGDKVDLDEIKAGELYSRLSPLALKNIDDFIIILGQNFKKPSSR